VQVWDGKTFHTAWVIFGCFQPLLPPLLSGHAPHVAARAYGKRQSDFAG